MFCNQCGKENPDNVVSCVHCGGPLAAVQSTYSGQQVPGAAPYATAAPPVTEPQTNGKATASLICGILSLTCFGLLTGIPAIILGHISKSEIRKSLGRMKGEGMALAGLIMGYISVAALPVLIIAAIAIPNLLKARMAANEASAAGSVRTVVTASASYQIQKNTTPAGLDDLKEANLIDPTLASGTKSGYNFTYSLNGDSYFVTATPAQPGTTGVRSFCAAGNDGVIRVAARNEECTIDSPPLQ